MSGKNFELGKSVLRVWFDAAASYPRNFSNFDSLIRELESDKMVSLFGDTVFYAEKNVGIDRIHKIAKDYAVVNMGNLPTFPDGFPNINSLQQSIVDGSAAKIGNISFVKKVADKVATDTVKDVASASKWFLGGSALFFIGIAGFALFLNLRKK